MPYGYTSTDSIDTNKTSKCAKNIDVKFINHTTVLDGGVRLRSTSFCIICFILLVAPVANCATIPVSSNLQAAIDRANPGDTLQVDAGVYDKIVIQKSLSLIGSGSLIKAGDKDACVSIEANNVNFSGFAVREGFYGIKLTNVKGCKIFNNTVMHCTQPGIALLYSDGNIITGNNASLNGLGGEGWYGIYLSNSNDNIIAINSAYGNGAYGICLFPSCNNNTIKGNVLQGNMYGLYMFTSCTNNTIESNDMSKNTNSGLDLRFKSIKNLIQNNTIELNVVSGLTLMEESGQNIIKGNVINGNGRYGLQVQSRSDSNTIINNNISNSQSGIFLESKNNRIYGNRILENVIQADDRDKNVWYAAYPTGGNLWSDYQGQDDMRGPNQDVLGKDGIGDEPYTINKISRDEYPIIGDQVKQISIIDNVLSTEKAKVGDSIAVKAKLKSKYELAQVTVRAYHKGDKGTGYARLTLSEGFYQGKYSTALLNPGKYEIVLSAKDLRGYELQETIGEIDLIARGGFTSL